MGIKGLAKLLSDEAPDVSRLPVDNIDIEFCIRLPIYAVLICLYPLLPLLVANAFLSSPFSPHPSIHLYLSA